VVTGLARFVPEYGRRAESRPAEAR